MTDTVSISRTEFQELVTKTNLFDHFVATEELTPEELEQIEKALKTPTMSKSEFLARHPQLN